MVRGISRIRRGCTRGEALGHALHRIRRSGDTVRYHGSGSQVIGKLSASNVIVFLPLVDSYNRSDELLCDKFEELLCVLI